MVVPRFDRADRFHVAVQSEGMATVGEAEPIVPPFDHHTIDNPTDKVAITLHVYGGDLTRCTVYVPTEDGWREDVLALDVDHAPVRRAA